MNTAQQIDDILRRLQNARKARHMSQAEVAEYFDWSASNIGMIETNRTNLKMEVFLTLCEIYGIDPGETITGKKPRVVETLHRNNGHPKPALSAHEKRILDMVRNGLISNFELLNELLDGLEV